MKGDFRESILFESSFYGEILLRQEKNGLIQIKIDLLVSQLAGYDLIIIYLVSILIKFM